MTILPDTTADAAEISAPPLRTGATLITGASSGLGRGLALALAARGEDLALCARRVDQLEAVRDAILGTYPGARVLLRSLDVNDHDAVFTAFRELDDALGGFERVIVNAGVGAATPVGQGGFARNRAVLETNLVAALAQCEAAVERFRARGRGHLVCMSSVSASRGLPGSLTVYAASKAGLSALAEGIRADVRGTDLRVTTLCPGFIETEMTAGKRRPMMVDLDTGVAALLRAIDAEVPVAYLPRWPWAPVAFLMRHLPLPWVARLAGGGALNT